MKKFIKDFRSGQEIDTYFLLKKKEIAKTKENKPYLKLTLADKSGSIEGRLWDNAEEYNKTVDSGMVVHVRGSVDSWRESTQLKVDDLFPAETGKYNMPDLMRVVEDKDVLFSRLLTLMESMKDKDLSTLWARFLADADFMSRFSQSPGAQSWHNAYIGGLLEHTLEVMIIADKVCELYPDADRDLCIMGAFLHDIGKVIEISAATFEQTLQGGLIGHLPLGFEILVKKLGEIGGFPDATALHLKHIVLSHHGEYEQQSPVLPKTLESTIIYHSDALVSQANAVKEVIKAPAEPQRLWSNYISIKNRKYLLSKPKE